MDEEAWQEADIREGVGNGGIVRGVFIVCRHDGQKKGHVAYLRTNWARGFRPLRTYRERSDRIFRSLDTLVDLIRTDFRFAGEISLFVAGAEELRRFQKLLPADRTKGPEVSGQ